MQQRILQAIHNLEQEHQVKVLLSAESGSRAWGFASPDSDYDVRFIYVHQPQWYFNIKPQADTIDVMLDDHLLDLSGWELRKALGLMMKTNPAMSDWLESPIVYYADEDFLAQMRLLNAAFYSPKAGIGHFLSLAHNHLKRYLQVDGEGYTLKRVLYYLRALLCCRWLEKNETHPPVLFTDLVEATVPEQHIKDIISDMLVKKSASREHNKDAVDSVLTDYAFTIFTHYQQLLPHYQPRRQPTGRESDLSAMLMATVLS